jgi:ubiquinol-cytochrome c reductase cytochrome c subunit
MMVTSTPAGCRAGGRHLAWPAPSIRARLLPTGTVPERGTEVGTEVRAGLARRTLTVLGGLAILTVLLVPVTGRAGGEPRRAGTVAAQPSPSPGPSAGLPASAQPTAEQQRGRELYLSQCAACHGADLDGARDGSGPSLRQVGGASAADFVLRTGRMPLASPDDVPRRGPSRFNEAEIRALVAFIGTAVGDPEVATAAASDQPDVLARGRELFSENCAACHGVNGAGAAIGGGYDAPSLHPVDARTVAEAMRTGPGRMPVFSGPEWPQRDVDAVASYVLTLGERRIDRGGLPIGGRGPVAEGFVAWVIGLGLIVVAARLIGSTGPRRTPPEEDVRDAV